VLAWARRTGAYILEDDYDSEFRYVSKPVPALQGLDPAVPMIFMGSFSKMLFTSLRLAYAVVPDALIDPLHAVRFHLDRFSSTLDQVILCDFLTEGHLGRHLRRMRGLYAERLSALRSAGAAFLGGAVTFPDIHAGLHIAAHLALPLEADSVEKRAEDIGVEAWSVHRFAVEQRNINALLLGFAAFEEREIRSAMRGLAAAILNS